MSKCVECGKSMNALSRDHYPICHQCRKEQNQANLNPFKVLPPEVPNTIINNLETGTIKNEINKTSLYLYGRSGCGKSHRAASIMFENMKIVSASAWAQYIWANVPLLLFSIRKSFDIKGEEDRIVKMCSKADFLCLDDLGAEKSTDWVFQTLYLIINERYENERQTIFTSNLSIQDLVDKMEDDRLVSRINAMCKIEEILGYDRRAK